MTGVLDKRRKMPCEVGRTKRREDGHAKAEAGEGVSYAA